MQQNGIILLFLVGLSGSEYRLSKKSALTTFRIRLRGRQCQMKCSIEGNQGYSEVGRKEGESGLNITSLNSHFAGFQSGTRC